MNFKKVAKLDDLWNGEMLGFEVDGQRIILIKLNDTFYAYEDRCAHQGVKLSEGILQDSRLICGAHFWEYDVSSGKGINPSGVGLKAFDLKIEDGNILVDMDSKRPLPSAESIISPDFVGPVLECGKEAEAIVASIKQLNKDVKILNKGSYLRVLAPSRCIVTQEAIELNLGKSFQLPGDLEKIMPSFKGIFSVSPRKAIWSLKKVSF